MSELIEEYTERRHRTLSDDDIEAIAKAISKHNKHTCRFSDLDPKVTEAAVEFYINANKIISDSKGIVGKTMLVLIVTGMFAMLVAGAVTELFKRVPK